MTVYTGNIVRDGARVAMDLTATDYAQLCNTTVTIASVELDFTSLPSGGLGADSQSSGEAILSSSEQTRYTDTKSGSSSHDAAVTNKTYTFTHEHTAREVVIVGSLTMTKWLDSSNRRFSGTSMARATLTIPARLSYTVTLDGNGGTGAPATATKWQNENLYLPQPIREGYEFAGWAYVNIPSVIIHPGEPYSINAAVDLVAVWTPVIDSAYITDITAYRADSSGNVSDDGGYVKIEAGWEVKGAKAVTVSLSASMDSTPTWTGSTQTASKTASEYTKTGTVEWLTTNVAAISDQYHATVSITADDKSDERSAIVPQAFFTMDVLAGGHGIAFGKPATQQLFDVGMETNFDHDVRVLGTPLVPVGTILDFAGETAPSGYLVCDGSEKSRTTYAALFAAIGTKWGAGDGSTTFNIPDFRGRVSIGSGTGTASDATAHILGSTSGTEKHTLTGAESGTSAHGHGFTQPTIQNHHHAISGNESYNLTSSASNGFAVGEFKIGTTGTTYSGFIRNAGTGNIIIRDSNNTQNTQPTATGGAVGQSTEAPASQPHNNMQPYATVTKIIRAL